MKKDTIGFTIPEINSNDALGIISKSLVRNFPNEGMLTEEFEKKLKKLLKVKYVVTTTSGTAALFLALKAINIKKGDEVIVPNITFPATANAVNMTGAKVVLADVSKKTLLLDVSSLKKKITKKTKAIIPVHISGRGSNIRDLCVFAKKNKIKIVEDAAEALGSKNNRKFLGSFGVCGCFSLAPNKIITTGQGGLVVTNDKNIYKKIKRLKDQGRSDASNTISNYSLRGYNFKFTDLQAGLGLSQLKEFHNRSSKLKKIYKNYEKLIKENDKLKLIGFNIKIGELPLWVDLYCSKADKLFNYLKRKGINCRYFWTPINQMPVYKMSSKNFSNSNFLKNKLIWLPSPFTLKIKEQMKVCCLINNFIEQNL